MKRLTKAVSRILIAAMITISMMLSGCSGDNKADTSPQALAVLIGNHACSKGINFSNLIISETITDAIMSNGFVSVINVDGKPDIVAANSYEIPEQYSHADKNKLRDDANKKANSLLCGLAQVKADDPEVDTLESLDLAIRTFSDLPSDMSKTILIIDTGLSTAGILDFSNNILSANSEAVVEQLSAQHAIPDFSGVTVIWLQMGDTAAPQQDLTDLQRANLIDIWQGIVESNGGIFQYSGAVPVEQTAPADSMPAVSPIDLPGENAVSFDQISLQDSDAFTEPVFLSEKQVQFVADSDKYLDKDRAESVIEPIADYIRAHDDFRLMLIGTTAGDNDDSYTLNLSLRRAEAVRNTLVAMGVNGDRIECMGMGNSDPWHISGVGTSGDMAAQNRKVVLIDERTASSLGIS